MLGPGHSLLREKQMWAVLTQRMSDTESEIRKQSQSLEAGKVVNCCTKLEDQAEKEWEKEEASRIEVQAGDFGVNPFHIEHVRAFCQSASLGLLQSLRCQIRLDNMVNYKIQNEHSSGSMEDKQGRAKKKQVDKLGEYSPVIQENGEKGLDQDVDREIERSGNQTALWRKKSLEFGNNMVKREGGIMHGSQVSDLQNQMGVVVLFTQIGGEQVWVGSGVG